MAEAVGLDIGGTKIAALRVDRGGKVLARDVVATPADDSAGIVAAAVQAARSVMSPEVSAIGAGVAGMVDHSAGVLRYAPNLAWRELPLAARISSELALPCTVDNDAKVAAWGEFLFGAGKGSSDMLLVTVGTGIGGGIVSGGRMYRGAHGFAGEIGHVIVEPGGPVCGCGNRGCWEQVASGRAIDRMAREAVEQHPESTLARFADGERSAVDGKLVTRAAEDGDDIARSILASVGRRLGQGIAGLANVLDPDLVVVGGGAMAAGDMLLGPAREAFRDALEAPEHRPEVPLLAALLGNDAGAIGAAAMALGEVG